MPILPLVPQIMEARPVTGEEDIPCHQRCITTGQLTPVMYTAIAVVFMEQTHTAIVCHNEIEQKEWRV
jgi:hypothetical protein